MLTIHIGEAFQLAGALQRDATTSDFTHWQVRATLSGVAGAQLIAELTVTWIEPSRGLFKLTAPSTVGWPAGKARIDFRVTTPAGEVIMGPPAYLRIDQSSTE